VTSARLYLDQNYLSGIAKRKAAFAELELLRELSNGHKLPDTDDRASREVRRRLQRTIAYELPERHAPPSDAADLDALAQALTHCDLVTCDAFMADVIRRARLHLPHRAELFSGRRGDVNRLRDRLQTLQSGP
jgi:hypothetical protein